MDYYYWLLFGIRGERSWGVVDNDQNMYSKNGENEKKKLTRENEANDNDFWTELVGKEASVRLENGEIELSDRILMNEINDLL